MEWTVMRSVEEVFFSKVSGKFPEIFEKSIDKHKIDAILDAPSSRSGPFFTGAAGGRCDKPEDSEEESGSHPDTRIPMKIAVASVCFAHMEGAVQGHCASEVKGVVL